MRLSQEALALDGAVDYKSEDESVGAQLDRLAPEGIDFLFDNTGGPCSTPCSTGSVEQEGARRLRRASRYSGNLNRGEVVAVVYLKLAERARRCTRRLPLHAQAPAALAYLWWLTAEGS